MDKIKLYNITWGTYTSNDIRECLVTNNVWKRKIRMLGFKERITKIASKIFDPRKRERWKKIEDIVKIITKVKADGIIKNKVGL